MASVPISCLLRLRTAPGPIEFARLSRSSTEGVSMFPDAPRSSHSTGRAGPRRDEKGRPWESLLLL